MSVLDVVVPEVGDDILANFSPSSLLQDVLRDESCTGFFYLTNLRNLILRWLRVGFWVCIDFYVTKFF